LREKYGLWKQVYLYSREC